MSNVYEGRLLRKVVFKQWSGVSGAGLDLLPSAWVNFRWQDVSGGMMRELFQSEVNDMLLSVALRNVRE